MAPKKVAMLTAGGLAPCLSSCVASLIECYSEKLPETEVYCYLNGFRALPISDKIRVTPEMARQIHHLHSIGGSPIGNSRVSLDNAPDCYRRRLVPEGENPWHVACDALVRDGIEVIHPIGGDGTSVGAARLAHYSHERHAGYKLAVIGLPKTIDNDIVPISQSLGAHTAASESAKFFRNVVGENTASDHFLLVHEIMGRNCGYLAAEAARMYREEEKGLAGLTGSDYKRDLHAVYVPEMAIDFEREVARLRGIMKRAGCVNVFVSEGACLDMIVGEIERSGETVERDQSGNIMLSRINVGEWISENFGKRIGATTSLVQKSGYFSRAAPADEFDRDLIRRCCEVAVDEAVKGSIGIVGPNENKNGKIELIPLDQIKGGRVFDVTQDWFVEMMRDIGQCSKRHAITRAISLPHPASIVKGAKEGLFTKKEEISENLEFDNEINFALAHSALMSSTETEVFQLRNILRSACAGGAYFSEKEESDLSEILASFFVSFKHIESLIKNAGVVGDEEAKNAFKMLELVAAENVKRGLASIPAIKKIVVLKNEEEFVNSNLATETAYDVYCDPLDGASNIIANVPSGAIFGIYRHNSDSDFQCGRNQLLAGYCLFGTSVVLVLSFCGKVIELRLNPSTQSFELKSNNIRIPPTGNCFSVNMGYYPEWDDQVKTYVENCKNRSFKLRYVGSMVADIHRTLFNGGLFFYPSNDSYPNGKLDLMTEANPIAFLIENAGGGATTGRAKVSHLTPSSAKEKTPFFAGSISMVSEFENLGLL